MQRLARYEKEKAERAKVAFFEKYPKEEAEILFACQTELLTTIEAYTRRLHVKLFSEEYDFMCDDNVDARRRSQGENPMRKEYQEEVNAKRVSLGFKPLSPAGTPEDSAETYAYCRKKVLGLIVEG